MNISGVVPAQEVLRLGALQVPVNKPRTDSESKFGPAYLLGEPTTNFSQGLYNSLGVLQAGKASVAAVTSESENKARAKRIESLKSAASKIANGDTQGGRAEAERLLDENPSDALALNLVARSYLNERDYKQAERFFARASALAPQSKRLAGDLANARALQKSDREALAEARDKLAVASRRNEGIRLLFHLSDRSPDNAEVYLALADGLAETRSPAAVLGALGQAAQHADSKQIDEVISRAEKVVRQHPTVGLPHNVLGRALQKAGRLDEAITEYERAAQIAPDKPSYQADLAGAYVARALRELAAGNLESARFDMQAARTADPLNSELDPTSARLAAVVAKRDIESGRYNKALGELSTAAAKAPDDDEQYKREVAGLYVRVAAHFENNGDDLQALSSYTKAYELNPDSAVARRKVGELGHQEGLNALARNDYDEAITYLDRAYQAFRDNTTYGQDLANAYDLRGQQRVSQGQLDDAIDDFQKGLLADPTNASVLTNLAAALAQKNGA